MTRTAVRTLTAAALALSLIPPRVEAKGARSFPTPEEAVRALVDTVKVGSLDGLLAFFGSEGRELVDTSDPATGRRNRQVFLAAMAEGWRLGDIGPGRKELVVGNEAWPFPMPLVKGAAGWSFDAAAGREEVLNRRIGNNELAVLRILKEYVAAQRAYAATGHDGKRAGLYARRFGSTTGKQDGLYWPSRPGEPRSPLGVLVAEASQEGYRRVSADQGPSPFHGYYFRILEGQGKSAKGGAADYVVNSEMSGAFGLVAWPVHYGASGIMTFVVNQEGVAHEKDLGAETAARVKSLTRYDPDPSWQRSETADAGR